MIPPDRLLSGNPQLSELQLYVIEDALRRTASEEECGTVAHELDRPVLRQSGCRVLDHRRKRVNVHVSERTGDFVHRVSEFNRQPSGDEKAGNPVEKNERYCVDNLPGTQLLVVLGVRDTKLVLNLVEQVWRLTHAFLIVVPDDYLACKPAEETFADVPDVVPKAVVRHQVVPGIVHGVGCLGHEVIKPGHGTDPNVGHHDRPRKRPQQIREEPEGVLARTDQWLRKRTRRRM